MNEYIFDGMTLITKQFHRPAGTNNEPSIRIGKSWKHGNWHIQIPRMTAEQGWDNTVHVNVYASKKRIIIQKANPSKTTRKIMGPNPRYAISFNAITQLFNVTDDDKYDIDVRIHGDILIADLPRELQAKWIGDLA